MLTRPGPDTTCSTSARPKRAVRSRSSAISRSVRAAKSAWPPFRGRRDEPAVHVVQQRDAQAGSGRDQRYVAVPDRFARAAACAARRPRAPGPRTPSPADRSGARRARCRTRSPRCAPRRATARWSAPRRRRATGPATPKQRAIDRATVDRSASRNAAIIDGEIGEVERRINAERRRRGRGRAGSNSPSSVLVPPMSPARIMNW